MKKIEKTAIFISIFSLFMGFSTTAVFGEASNSLPDTETIVDTVALQAPSTTYLPQTFGYLTFITDTFVTSVNEELVSTEDSVIFCQTVDKVFTDQDEATKQSFAWQKESYVLPEKTSDNLNEIQSSLYEKTFELRSGLVEDIELVAAMSEESIGSMNRLKAIYRSVLIEVMDEYRKDSSPDQERVETLLAFGGNIGKCIESKALVSDENSKVLENINNTHSQIVSLWFTNKSYLSTEAPTSEADSLTIKRDDLKDEDVSISSSGVSNMIDLEIFAKTLMRKDERIREITISDSNIEFVYAVDAKFLGFGRTFLREHVSIDPLGNTKVRLPWYGFLFKKGDMYKNNSEIQDKIKEGSVEMITEGEVSSPNTQAVRLENRVAIISGTIGE